MTEEEKEAIVERVAEELWHAESIRCTGRNRQTQWADEGTGTHAAYRFNARAALSSAGIFEALEALEPFAYQLCNIDNGIEDCAELWESSAAMGLEAGDIRRAAAALKKVTGK